jgi:predicted Zn-dependent peptidase
MPLTFKHHQLPNGLDVIAEIHPDSHTFAAGFYVKSGARDETPNVNGVSHFLEHMMFKGSSKYTWEDVNRIFDEIGANYNAFTSQEMTGYWSGVLPEFTERIIEHLSHLLRPALRDQDFTTEKQVILEEIAKYQDDPGHRLWEKACALHFGAHPLAQSVLGSVESVGSLQRDQMVDYFHRRYGPGNMVLAVAGRLDFDNVVKLAERYCGDWQAVNAPRQQPAPTYKAQQHRMSDPKLNRMYTMALTAAPGVQDERRFAARVLSHIIGDSDGSRFYWALVDNAIAEEADFSFYPHDGTGSFIASLVTSPDRQEQALDIALAELQRVKTDLNDAEVERAKNKIASGIVLSGEVPIGRMHSIGGMWIDNREYRSLEQDMRTLNAITPDTLRKLMSEFPFDPMTIVSLGPG